MSYSYAIYTFEINELDIKPKILNIIVKEKLYIYLYIHTHMSLRFKAMVLFKII